MDGFVGSASQRARWYRGEQPIRQGRLPHRRLEGVQARAHHRVFHYYPEPVSDLYATRQAYVDLCVANHSDGPGVGCPIAATTLKKQAQEIEADPAASSGSSDAGSESSSSTSTSDTTTEDPATSTPDAGASVETESSTLDITDSTTFDDEPTATNSPETSTPSETDDEPTPTSTSASTSTTTQSTSPTVTDLPQSTGSADGEASDDEIAALVPEFGIEQGANPTGTGDCDGVVGPAGSPIRIPCLCPPKRADFIQTLISNVRAGQVLNNPSVKVTFPVDDSKAGKQARLNAAAVTLQNLEGEGKGCPIAATTWKKLGAAIDEGTDVGGTAVGTAGASTTSAPASTGSPTQSSSSPEQSPATSAPAPSSTDAPANGTPSDAEIARLAPSLGFEAGQNPTGTGDCDGAVKNAKGQVIKVPCACPPTQDVFIAALQENVRAGQAVNNPSVKIDFPTGDSTEEQLTRINAAAITIQNLNGVGKGCPMASTTLGAQAQELRTGKTPSSSAPASSSSSSSPSASTEMPSGSSSSEPAPESTGAPEPATDDVVARLAPSLGHEAGINPTGTGNCDGAVSGADGKIVEVPCTCPPPQDVYIAALQRNVREGKAINNPSVGVVYPTDNSKESQSARITAALITLQNLNGLGKGCPAASTTLLKQQKALFP